MSSKKPLSYIKTLIETAITDKNNQKSELLQKDLEKLNTVAILLLKIIK